MVRPGEGINQRLFVPCPGLPQDPSEQLISCPRCGEFSLLCCFHPLDSQSSNNAHSCHHRCVAITDGACPFNGRPEASAGLGIVLGENGEAEPGQYDKEENQWSVPVDDTVDRGGERTNQRAELLAAIEAVKIMSKRYGTRLTGGPLPKDDPETREWIIVSDSDYVVKGITQWIYSWKRKGWRTSQGKRPANLDLFQKLDSDIKEVEQNKPVVIGFWHVKRQHTTLADGLARKAAKAARDISDAPRYEFTGLAIVVDDDDVVAGMTGLAIDDEYDD